MDKIISNGRGRSALFGLAITTLILNALDAYSFSDIPLARVGTLIPFVGIFLCERISESLRQLSGFLLLFFFLITVTLLECAFGNYSALMPHRYPGAYESFIALRAINYLSFVLFTCMLMEIFSAGRFRDFAKSSSILASAIAVYSIYVYVAQLYGYPEIPRSRIGTGGEAQATYFTYDFHRAMGTFREPSHLAEWMIVMVFLPFACWSGIRAVFACALMIGAVVLSGSLSAFIALWVALFFFGVIHVCGYRIKAISMAVFWRVLSVLAISSGLFYLISFAYESGGSANYFSTMYDRLAPVLGGEGVLGSTNRAYIYQWMEEDGGIPIWGYGLGNSNLILSAHFSNEVVYSFMGLFLNVLYSGGLIGLFILLFVYLKLAVNFFRRIKAGEYLDHRTVVSLGTYVCITVFFLGRIEEFHLLFSIPVALMLIPESQCLSKKPGAG